ncbi:Plasmodesmata-located protein 6 [Linum perenne]
MATPLFSFTTSSTLLFSVVVIVQLNGGVYSASIDTFIFGGCSQVKYTAGSPYESSLNSLLTSVVNSASFSLYNNFTTQFIPILYGIYQCRGDILPADCGSCVAKAVTQLGTLCASSCGGVLQLDGCFVKYDNVTFLGAEDKTVLFKKCGGSLAGYDDDDESYNTLMSRRDAVLNYVGELENKVYRVGGSGEIYAVAQCVQDLSGSECDDCVSEAVGLLKSGCGASAAWGDMFLGKCYARFSLRGDHSRPQVSSNNNNNSNNSDEEIEKTLAILIGLIAGVALLIVFLSFLRKLCDKGKGGK